VSGCSTFTSLRDHQCLVVFLPLPVAVALHGPEKRLAQSFGREVSVGCDALKQSLDPKEFIGVVAGLIEASLAATRRSPVPVPVSGPHTRWSEHANGRLHAVRGKPTFRSHEDDRRMPGIRIEHAPAVG